jgi:hypothetical protein
MIVIAVTLGTLGVWMLWKADNRQLKQNLQSRMDGFAEKAVELAQKEFATELDYRLQTLDRLEAILHQFHKRHQLVPIPEKELSQIVLIWGGYLGAVLKSNYGGHWEQDSIVAGKNTYPLHISKIESIPVIWCLRRIRNGEAANFLPLIEKLGREVKPVN